MTTEEMIFDDPTMTAEQEINISNFFGEESSESITLRYLDEHQGEMSELEYRLYAYISIIESKFEMAIMNIEGSLSPDGPYSTYYNRKIEALASRLAEMEKSRDHFRVVI